MTSLSLGSQCYIGRAFGLPVCSHFPPSFMGSSPQCHSRGAAGTLFLPGLPGAHLGSPAIIVAGQIGREWLRDIHLRVI